MTLTIIHWTPGEPVVQLVDAEILRRRTRPLSPIERSAQALLIEQTRSGR